VLLSCQSKNFQDANQLKTLKTSQRSIRTVKKVSKARQFLFQAQF
jgi:DNA-binding transcriptional regulator WhiA